ncbi:hypothetical protein AG0111_0g1480 [Alternaria gaisen]|uniref:Uncharacterized protein n=1 Tax=Alternaria gaisen TaxID=167740 RepID=A0ACB6G113_9PLEO|nr:hypothetical protein AG0111_0g1480 [Alternaria gaisen]
MAAIEAHGRRLVPASQCPAGPSPSISPNGRRHEIWVFEPTPAIEQTSLPSTQPSRQIGLPAATIYTPLSTSATVSGNQRASYSDLSAGSKAGIGFGITIGILTTFALAGWLVKRNDDFKTKHAMQIVRQSAMGSHLKEARKMAESRTSFSSQDASKPRSTWSLEGKGKKTSEVQTPNKATWKTTKPSVEDMIDSSSTITTTPDLMKSVFSAESSGTSIKVLSSWSMRKTSRKQLQIATRALVSVIQSDQVLGPIYEAGRNDPTLEPDELHGYVLKTLVSYAENLKNEAKDRLELTASNLVLYLALHAARCVSGDTGDDYKLPHGLMKDADDSSDDGVQEQPVDGRQFNDDLDAFRSFLTQSNAFTTLRTETQLLYPFQFITSITESSETHVGEDIQEHIEGGRSGKGLICIFNDIAMFMIRSLLISLECLEPPLETGWTRIKIKCHTCGERSFDDILEHREGGIAELKQWMERALNATITVVHLNEEAASTHGRWHSPALVHNILRGLQRIFRWGKPRKDPVLPAHNGPQLESELRRAKSPSPQRSSLRLMSCVHRNWEHRILLQDRVDHINTDREFFTFLKTQVRKRRCRVMRILSCRKIQAIHFTMFKLRMGNRLEVRDHRDCCKASCNCLPPRDHPDYDFACPLDSTYPVIPPRAFAHMLKHTRRDVHEDQTHIYRWVPKRKGTTLDVDPKTELADAWGLYFEEGWDPNDIMTLFGLVFVVSLVFLVCWSRYTSDVSAASGVSSYMITVAGIAISLLVIRAGNM